MRHFDTIPHTLAYIGMEFAAAHIAERHHAPAMHDVRMAVLNSLDDGFHGVEACETINGEFADYLNTGDTYAPTLIYWRGNYRVQSLGDFIERVKEVFK